MIRHRLTFEAMPIRHSLRSGMKGFSLRLPHGNCLRSHRDRSIMVIRSLFSLFVLLVGWAGLPVMTWAQPGVAPQERYHPLSQNSPPGMVAEWARQAKVFCPDWFQPVRLELPAEDGKVTFYDGGPQRPIVQDAPAQAALLVGRLYRLRISDLADYPGVEFFPSVEVVDRLHPPAGQIDEFPIVCQFTTEDLDFAAQGRLVTKVVYLEQPDRIPVGQANGANLIRDVPPHKNALAEADLLGRPMLIVRLGARQPDRHAPDPKFFGDHAPVQLRVEPSPAAGATTSVAPVSAVQSRVVPALRR